jgi:hypothetical protein
MHVDVALKVTRQCKIVTDEQQCCTGALALTGNQVEETVFSFRIQR